MTGSSQVPISMPVTGDQPDEQKKPGGGVFLGGPLSAMLLSLCFLEHDGILERTIPWFSLIPLFISLDRHRRNLKWRVMHGLFFGLILYCWPLVSWNEPANLATVWASLLMMGSWILFCAAGGGLLRYPSRLTVVPGLAILWTGLEFLRSECVPASVPWMQLGQALKPGNPEGQFASVIGLAGLGFAICLVNGAFFLTLRERQRRVQFFAALAGTGTVVGLLISGGLVGSKARGLEQPPPETLRIGLVQTGGGGNSEHIKLARQLLNSKPQLIFFPGNAFMPTSGKSSIPAELEVFAHEEGIEMLVAGMSLDPDDKSKKSRALLYSDSGGWHGDLVNSETLEILTKQDEAILAVSDRVSHSACRLKSLAAGGARLFLVAGDSAHDELKYDLLRDRLHAFRSLETGISICRATSSGSSSIVNHTGTRKVTAPRNQAWAMVSSVPLLDRQLGGTGFVKGGWIIGPGCLLLLAVLVLFELYTLRKKSNEDRNTGRQDSTRPS